MYLALVLPPPPDPAEGCLDEEAHPQLLPTRDVVQHIVPGETSHTVID